MYSEKVHSRLLVYFTKVLITILISIPTPINSMLCESLTNANRVFSFQMVVACGTEDVLTCHVILMRESRTGVTAIAHFDEFSRHWDFSGMMEDFLAKLDRVKNREEWEYDSEGDGDWEWWDESEQCENNSQSNSLDPGQYCQAPNP